MAADMESIFQGGKADPRMKRVWGWRWSVLWLVCLWICIGWAVILDLFLGAPIITIVMLLLSLFVMIICRKWASLYWKNYSFELLDDKIVVKRGIIGKRKVSIPYDRVQNVNVVQGVYERMFGVSNIQIETAGGSGPRGGGGYGARGFAEGTIQGLRDPAPMERFILEKAKEFKTGGPGNFAPVIMTGASGESTMVPNSLEIECAECSNSFLMPDRDRPFDVFCPYCGVKGVAK